MNLCRRKKISAAGRVYKFRETNAIYKTLPQMRWENSSSKTETSLLQNRAGRFHPIIFIG